VSDELYHAAHLIAEIGLESLMETATSLAIADREPPLEIIQNLLHGEWLAHVACG